MVGIDTSQKTTATSGRLDREGLDARQGGDSRRRISIIVPVYDEEENIRPLYQRIRETADGLGDPWELVFVDDGSRDQSLQIMQSLSFSDPRVKVAKLRRNYGQTAALAAGFDIAEGDVLIPLDADLQNDPADIPPLLAKLDEGYDIVSGWRKNRKDPFFSKSLPSWISNRLASAFSGVHLHDYGCTLKAYRRDIIEELNLYGEFHRFIPALASDVGARVAEIEVTHHARRFGRTKYGPGRILRGFLDLVTLKLLLAYQNRPMQLFGRLGLFSLGLGAASGIATLAMKVFIDADITGNPFLYTAILGLITGVQFIGLGFLGEMHTRTYYESQGKRIYAIHKDSRPARNAP